MHTLTQINCILIHISLVLLLSSRLHPCPSQNGEILLGFGHTAWLITLCTFWINRGTSSQTSPTSQEASSSNSSKSVPGSLTAPVQEQFLSGCRSENTHEDGEKTCGGQGSRKQGKKILEEKKEGKKKVVFPNMKCQLGRKKKKWEPPLSKYNFKL